VYLSSSLLLLVLLLLLACKLPAAAHTTIAKPSLQKTREHASTEAAKQTLDNQRCVGNNDRKLTLYNLLGAGGLSFTALNAHHVGGEQERLTSWRD